jgi:integrase
MSIRQRKDTGSWEVHVVALQPNGTKVEIRRSLKGATKRDAQQFHDNLRASILAGTYGRQEEKREVPTLAKFAEEFIDGYATSNNKPSTVEAKRMLLKCHILPAFGRRRLDEITARDIERFKGDRLKAGLQPKTVNNVLTALRKMLALAVEWELISHVPAIKWLKAPKPKFDFLTFEEAERLVAAAEPAWAAMIMVALRTGLRHGELMALRWDDVDVVAGRLVVSRSVWKGKVGLPKNGRTREIPLSKDAVAAFKAARHLKGELVFSNADGTFFRKGQCKHPLWRACKRAGLRRIGWHVLRHTFASHLVMRGVAMKAVQELMGHSTMEMTLRYAHLSPEVRRDAVTQLDAPPPAWAVQSRSTLTARDEAANSK